jgi:spore coat protein JB
MMNNANRVAGAQTTNNVAGAQMQSNANQVAGAGMMNNANRVAGAQTTNNVAGAQMQNNVAGAQTQNNVAGAQMQNNVAGAGMMKKENPVAGVSDNKSVMGLSKKALLKRLQVCEFVLVEVNLYLDTHPNDQAALDYFRKYVAMKEETEKEYVDRYGPIVATQAARGNTWAWIKEPWPWEMEREG